MRSLISWLSSLQLRAPEARSVWLPDDWQSPLEVERAGAGSCEVPVVTGAAGLAVFTLVGIGAAGAVAAGAPPEVSTPGDNDPVDVGAC